MPETDLYPPVKGFLEAQGYSVKAEVKDCDVVAIRGDEPPVIVELKSQFSLKLLLQGIDRQAISDTVYLAFQPPKRAQLSDTLKLCKRLGLGVLLVHGQIVEAMADPVPYTPRPAKKRITLLLKEFQHRVGDPNQGGSTRRPRMTAYRQDALRCVALIGTHGPSSIALMRSKAGVARAAGIVQNDVYGWFQREQRGIYGLSPKGSAALETYADVITTLKA